MLLDNMLGSSSVCVVSSNAELIQNLYNLLDNALALAVRSKRSPILIGLSGGSLIHVLSEIFPSLHEDYFQHVRFVFCDERLVPFDHPESTFGQYCKLVLPNLRPVLSKEHFICINTSLPVTECARDYERRLRDLVGNQEWPVLDMALLGIGPDGHTCSLFPGHSALSEDRLWVAPINDSPKPPPERVTLTLPVLNRAREIVIVATGSGKAEAVQFYVTDIGRIYCRRHPPTGVTKDVQAQCNSPASVSLDDGGADESGSDSTDDEEVPN